jgi:hypothetical protein
MSHPSKTIMKKRYVNGGRVTDSTLPAESPRWQRKQSVICVWSSLTFVLKPKLRIPAENFIQR